MRKHTLWMTIPVTTAVLLALAGCGGTNSNQTSAAGSTPPAAAGDSTQAEKGNTAASDSGDSGASGNTETAGSKTAGSNSNGSDSHPELSDVNDVVKAVRSELKMSGAVLPTSFPLPKDRFLGAVITTNTSDAFLVNFYKASKPAGLNDPSLTKSNSKVPWLASYEVKTYSNPNQTDIFPETNLDNFPEDMTVDLGHGIKGMIEGAAGSQYLTWQEGRWTMQIRSVSEDQMNNPGIAKKMVDYLETHMLPAPKDKGYVNVEYASGGKTVRVTISWQDGKQIHQLKTEQVPLDALQMVVSVK